MINLPPVITSRRYTRFTNHDVLCESCTEATGERTYHSRPQAPIALKRGGYSTETVTHYLGTCDVCGEVTYLIGSAFSKTATDPIPGRPCRMTPSCTGKHRKPALNNEETS